MVIINILNLKNNQAYFGEYSTQQVLESSRNTCPILLSILCDKKDQNTNTILNIKKRLAENEEIQHVYINENDKISKCHLLLFFCTKGSKNSNFCLKNISKALTQGIGIIPIKGNDIKWNDLKQIDLGVDFYLSDKLGFEFEKFCCHINYPS